MDEHLLSKIRIVPGFLDPAECASLRAVLDATTGDTRAAGVKAGQPPTLDPKFWPGDLKDPGGMLECARDSAAGRFIIDRYRHFGDDGAGIETALSGAELVEAVLDRAQPILARIVSDRGFYPAIASRITLPAGSLAEAELAELLAAGALVRTEDGFRESETITPDLVLALAWFNVRLLEDVIFPGLIEKSSRLLHRDVAPNAFLARLESVDADHPGAGILALLRERFPEISITLERRTRVSFLSAFRRILWSLEIQNLLLDTYRDRALSLLETRADRNRHCFDALRSRERGAALRAAGGSYPRCRAVHAMLHLFFPEEVQAPAEPDIAMHVRDVQVLEDRALRPRIDAVVRRLAREHAEPYYGIHVSGEATGTQVLRYTAGSHYIHHVDSEASVIDANGDQQWVKALPRDLSVVIYLSRESDFSGGALHFAGLCSVAPTEGMAVMFPSDHRFPHAAQPVTQGTRYAIVSWLQCEEGTPVGERHRVNW